MSLFPQSQDRNALHIGYKGAVVFGALFVAILSLVSCSTSRKEYVVDYTRGNDVTAQGSRELPCHTEVHCRLLAERDGVRAYWLVYQ